MFIVGREDGERYKEKRILISWVVLKEVVVYGLNDVDELIVSLDIVGGVVVVCC